jgi:hypothetical protein
VALAAALWLVRQQDDPATVSVPPSSTDTMTQALPAPGKVRAIQLADGTPAWLVRHDNGSTTVVSAISTHAPNGLHQLVGWCAAGRNFEDGMYGSTWDEHGARMGGPAPTGLSVASVQALSRRRIKLGPFHVAKSERAGLAENAKIKTCFSNPPMGFDSALNKTLSAFEREPTTFAAIASQAYRGADSRVEYLPAAALVVTSDQSVLLCPVEVTPQESACTDGPLVTGVDAHGVHAMEPEAVQVVHGNLLLRIDDGTVLPLAFTRGYVLDMFPSAH